MSHTTKVAGIAVQSIPALRKAVEFLQQQGIQCALEENTAPRAYFPDQPGMGTAPFVLRLNGSRYDVGLYQQADKTYEARTDFWQDDVQNVLGVPQPAGATTDQYKLGKFYQAYALCAAEEKARQQGYQVSRLPQSDGQIKLVVNGYH